MLIRFAPRAESGELGDDDAWRSEYCRAPCEGRAGRFRRSSCEFDVHGDQKLPGMREAVEPVARADTVTVIWRDRMRVFEGRLVARRDSDGDVITQVAMWWIRCKPEQQRAE
jgi:hypothetical protein